MANAREQIVAAARQVFETRGYADVSVRDVAQAAGVSPALVIKHCGSKADLFRAAAGVEPSSDPFPAPLERLGESLVQRIVDAHREGRPSPLSRSLVLVVGAPDPEALRTSLRTAYLERLAAMLVDAGVAPAEAARRAQLVLTLLVGLSGSLRLLHLFDGSDAELVQRYAGLVQDALDGR